MTRVRFSLLFPCVVGCLIVRALMSPVGAQPVPLDFSQVVIFATHSAKIDRNVDILSGDIVVNEPRSSSSSATLTPGFELSIGKGATTPNSLAVVAADRVSISKNAVVGGSVLFNFLRNSGVIMGAQITPVPLPVFLPAEVPPFQTGVPGSMDIVVGSGQVVPLAPGNYRRIRVEQDGMLTFLGGVYNVQAIKVRARGKLAFDAPRPKCGSPTVSGPTGTPASSRGQAL